MRTFPSPEYVVDLGGEFGADRYLPVATCPHASALAVGAGHLEVERLLSSAGLENLLEARQGARVVGGDVNHEAALEATEGIFDGHQVLQDHRGFIGVFLQLAADDDDRAVGEPIPDLVEGAREAGDIHAALEVLEVKRAIFLPAMRPDFTSTSESPMTIPASDTSSPPQSSPAGRYRRSRASRPSLRVPRAGARSGRSPRPRTRPQGLCLVESPPHR